MLVLSRKLGERIVIGDGVVVAVLAICGRQVKLGIEAPAFVPIRREELAVLAQGTWAGGEAGLASHRTQSGGRGDENDDARSAPAAAP